VAKKNQIDMTEDGWDDRDWERTTDCFWCGEVFSTRRARCPECGSENYS
jgi:uncharacterized OB-fold protein